MTRYVDTSRLNNLSVDPDYLRAAELGTIAHLALDELLSGGKHVAYPLDAWTHHTLESSISTSGHTLALCGGFIVYRTMFTETDNTPANAQVFVQGCEKYNPTATQADIRRQSSLWGRPHQGVLRIAHYEAEEIATPAVVLLAAMATLHLPGQHDPLWRALYTPRIWLGGDATNKRAHHYANKSGLAFLADGLARLQQSANSKPVSPGSSQQN